MRTFSQTLTDMFRRPPILLPLVGIAHIVGFIYVLWECRNVEGLSTLWLQPLWMLGYTFFWLACCNLKRWGVYGYLALTIANTLIYVTADSISTRSAYTSNLFLFDIVFSFFLIIYYKRLQ